MALLTPEMLLVVRVGGGNRLIAGCFQDGGEVADSRLIAWLQPGRTAWLSLLVNLTVPL